MGLRRSRNKAAPEVPNMNSPAFKAAASTHLNLTKRFTSFPSNQDLEALPEARRLKAFIVEFLQHVPRLHCMTWRNMLLRAYPELEGNELDEILTKLVVRCWRLRASAKPYALHDFIEFCAGQGNLTMACLRSMLYGLCLDLLYHEDHNMITRKGLRFWIDCISESKIGAMCWWGTRCSSWSGMSRRYHKRSASNNFWGDCSRLFVRQGNVMQVVTALTMMFSYFCGCSPVLEQPTGSCMPKTEPLHTVLPGIGAKKWVIWHGAWGGTSPKPLQLWSARDLKALVRPRPKKMVSDSLVRKGQKRMSDNSTKATYTGTKALKQSQTYCMAFGKAVALLAKIWVTQGR